jgi:hypothetical protein
MSQQIIPPARPQERGMMIRTLVPRLPERGKIKIGGLDPRARTAQSGREWQPPVKYDHFVITTLRRGGARHDRRRSPDRRLPDHKGAEMMDKFNGTCGSLDCAPIVEPADAIAAGTRDTVTEMLWGYPTHPFATAFREQQRMMRRQARLLKAGIAVVVMLFTIATGALILAGML